MALTSSTHCVAISFALTGWASVVFVVSPCLTGADHTDPQRVCVLADRDVIESSGLAASGRRERVFWTHNDSGDGPRVYAFDMTGKSLGTFQIEGARASDWEDIAAFDDGGEPSLLIADVGDNDCRRSACCLYLVREPVLPLPGPIPTGRRIEPTLLPLVRKIEFKYSDGAHDCEAIAVDPQNQRVILAVKRAFPLCTLYSLPLSKEPDSPPLVAKPIGFCIISAVTAMDITSDGRRAVLLSYGGAYCFERSPQETWQTAFCHQPVRIGFPIGPQVEAVCFGADGKTLYMTSEGRACPLIRIPFRD